LAQGAGSWTGRLTSTGAALVPACLAAAHIPNLAAASHDVGVARALGLDGQPWRALDAPVASFFAAIPIGTHAARAALGSSLVVAAAGMALYHVTRRVSGSSEREAPFWGAATALLATWTALCAPPWQLEAAAVAGSATGALLALAPLALLASGDAAARAPWRAAALALGLALGYDPLVGACALGASGALVAAGPDLRKALRAALATDVRGLSAAGIAGLAPWVLAIARTRALGLRVLPALVEPWPGGRGTPLGASPIAFARDEIGTVVGALAVAGAVFACLRPRTRPLASGLITLAVLGLATVWAGAPAEPARFGPTVLAAMAAACALAGVSMHALVGAIAESKLPLSRASAVMVLVLLLAIPVDSADSALEHARSRGESSASLWDDAAWTALPARAVVLVTDPRLAVRAAASRALGSLRGDIAVVTALPRGTPDARVLASDAALVPLWRDLELAGSPSEASLSSLAEARPLVMAYEPRWGRVLGKHLVPVALLDRFEPEPRGTSDRRRALEGFARKRERLARGIAGDPDLSRAAAYLLRARLLDVASSGDRDLVGRAVEDLRAFAPDDPVATAVVARVVLGHGAARLEDLRP
jgi:hypothetical protein